MPRLAHAAQQVNISTLVIISVGVRMCQIPYRGKDGFGGQNTCDAWQSISSLGVMSHPRTSGLVEKEHIVTTIVLGIPINDRGRR